MSSAPSDASAGNAALIKEAVSAVGACACGIACAGESGEADLAALDSWLRQGRHAGMDYMLRNSEIRRNPCLLHEGARTVVAAAFNYRPAAGSKYFADYSLGADYHYVLKQRLGLAADAICARLGGSYRVVVDSAPMRERYWAVNAGIGFRADNGMVCVPGYGMAVVLGFILWTGEAEADKASQGECLHCGRCRRACPGGALGSDGAVDARRCLSYLSIEHRGDFPDDMPPMPKVYGCDCCRYACPLDCGPATDLPEFLPDESRTALNPESMTEMTAGQFRRLFGSSAVSRLRVQGLRRNALKYITLR